MELFTVVISDKATQNMGLLGRKVDEMREFAFLWWRYFYSKGLLCPEGFFKGKNDFVHHAIINILDGLLVGRGKHRTKLDLARLKDTQGDSTHDMLTIEYLYLIRFV